MEVSKGPRLIWNASGSLANTIGLNRVDNALIARKKDVSNQALIYEDNVHVASRRVVAISVITSSREFRANGHDRSERRRDTLDAQTAHSQRIATMGEDHRRTWNSAGAGYPGGGR